jgi:hypothetical protein
MCSSVAPAPFARGMSSIAARNAVRASSSAVWRRVDGFRLCRVDSQHSPTSAPSHVLRRPRQALACRRVTVDGWRSDTAPLEPIGLAVSTLHKLFEKADNGIGGKCGVLRRRKAFPIVNFGRCALCLSSTRGPVPDKSHAAQAYASERGAVREKRR